MTRYRMSRSLAGPLASTARRYFDGRPLRGQDGLRRERRFVFGWNPTREGEKDYRNWHWGGNLVVHEIVQECRRHAIGEGAGRRGSGLRSKGAFCLPAGPRRLPRDGRWR